MLSDGAVISTLGLAIGISSSAVVLYVRSSIMELRSEFKTEVFNMKEAVIQHINTSYVKKESCVLREDAMKGILDLLRRDIDRDAHKREREHE